MERARHATAAALMTASLLAVAAACGSGRAATSDRRSSTTSTTASSTTSTSVAPTTTAPSTTAATTAPTTTPPLTAPSSPPAAAGLGALRGHTVVIDPGHDGGNGAHPDQINRQVPSGTGTKECDTTGTQTDGGYAEHAYTWDVAERLAEILQANGAVVVLTRTSDTGVGPCVDQRAAIGNQHPGAIGLSIHADGGPPGGRGFHVIRPAGIDGLNTAIVEPSARLAADVRDAYQAATGEPQSTYLATDHGIVARNDLAGLNLSQIPKVFVECLNMREATDAARALDPGYRQTVAAGLAAGLARYFAA